MSTSVSELVVVPFDPALVSYASACSFKSILPNHSRCQNPGFSVELLLFILSFFKCNIQLKVVPATGYGFKRWENDTPILEQLLSNKANVSPPLTLTYARAKLLQYSTPFLQKGLVYSYKDVGDVIVPKLGFELLPKPIILFLLLLVLLQAMKKITVLLLNKKGVAHNLACQVEKRINLHVSLALAILLGCVSSYVVTIFGMPPPKLSKPIFNLETLLNALESNEYTAITHKSYVDRYLNPVNYTDHFELAPRLIAAAKTNPPVIFKSDKDTKQLLLNHSHGKYVALTQYFLNSGSYGDSMNADCRLYKVPDPDIRGSYGTVYFSPSWKLGKTLTRSQVALIDEEHKRLHRKYNPPIGCATNDESKEITSNSLTIKLGQVQGALWFLLLLLAFGFAIFCLEIGWGCVTKRFAEVTTEEVSSC